MKPMHNRPTRAELRRWLRTRKIGGGSNEITISGSLAIAKGSLASESLAVSGLKATLVGKQIVKATQTIPTTAGGTAINIGALGSVGWAFIKNLDITNYVEILNAVSGTPSINIPPGLSAGPFKFATGVTAPAALAHTASVDIEFEIAEL